MLSTEADHGRFRRSLAHAFSGRALWRLKSKPTFAKLAAEKELRKQETMIQSYTDLLVTQLSKQIDGAEEGVLNIVSGCHLVTNGSADLC